MPTGDANGDGVRSVAESGDFSVTCGCPNEATPAPTLGAQVSTAAPVPATAVQPTIAPEPTTAPIPAESAVPPVSWNAFDIHTFIVVRGVKLNEEALSFLAFTSSHSRHLSYSISKTCVVGTTTPIVPLLTPRSSFWLYSVVPGNTGPIGRRSPCTGRRGVQHYVQFARRTRIEWLLCRSSKLQLEGEMGKTRSDCYNRVAGAQNLS